MDTAFYTHTHTSTYPWLCVCVYPNPMPEKKYMNERRAFGPEIYIIHWDYLILEYDDVTTRSLYSAHFYSHIAHSMEWHALVRISLSLCRCVCVCVRLFLLHLVAPPYLFVLQHKCHWHRLYVHQTYILLYVAVWFVQSSYIVVNAEHFSWYLHVSPSYRMLDFTYFPSDMFATSYLFIYFVNIHTRMRYKGALPKIRHANPINEQYAYSESHSKYSALSSTCGCRIKGRHDFRKNCGRIVYVWILIGHVSRHRSNSMEIAQKKLRRTLWTVQLDGWQGYARQPFFPPLPRTSVYWC